MGLLLSFYKYLICTWGERWIAFSIYAILIVDDEQLEAHIHDYGASTQNLNGFDMILNIRTMVGYTRTKYKQREAKSLTLS